MPRFDRITVSEAKMKTATGKRAQIIAEYVGYIEQLGDGKAGRLQAAEGEPITTVRRRLGAAARQLKKSLTIRRTWARLKPKIDDRRIKIHISRARPASRFSHGLAEVMVLATASKEPHSGHRATRSWVGPSRRTGCVRRL